MSKEIITTPNAPKAIGPYNQAVINNEIIYTSGQIAIDPKTQEVINGGIFEQTHQVFKNLEAIVNEGGSSFDNVIKTTCFLASMDDFQVFNEVYSEYFREPYPSRSCVAVKTLPKNVLVEIELIASVI